MQRIGQPIRSSCVSCLLFRKTRGGVALPIHIEFLQWQRPFRRRVVSWTDRMVTESWPSMRSGVFLGIDPDVGGAMGMIDVKCGENGSLEATARVVDNPFLVEVVNKQNRRRLNPAQVLKSIEEVRISASGREVKACLEAPLVFAVSGKLSRQITGYMFGLWHGILLANAIEVETASPALWKRRLGLHAKGKEGSLELARKLFPSLGDDLKRKKDHGRAEGLLLAAYGAGLRVVKDEEVISFDDATSDIQQPIFSQTS